MERRAASHTEEEEMNQRRKLLNAARRGDTKAISKLFELYQVRVLSGDQLAKVNKNSVYMAPVGPTKGGRSSASGSSKGAKPAAAKAVKPEPKQRVKGSLKTPAKTTVKAPVKEASGKLPKTPAAKKPPIKHK